MAGVGVTTPQFSPPDGPGRTLEMLAVAPPEFVTRNVNAADCPTPAVIGCTVKAAVRLAGVWTVTVTGVTAGDDTRLASFASTTETVAP